MFITFEGIDGSGKTTQLQKLRKILAQRGYEVVVTREPGGTKLAEAIRAYLLHSAQPLSERAELLLFGAARAQHVAEVIRPALERNAWVLSDRFADSSLAYQGGGLGLDTDFIRQMNEFATGDLQPDLTFLLDVDPQEGWRRRATERDDRIEERGLDFQQRVREAYLKIAEAEPDRVLRLDGNQPPETVAQEVWAAMQKFGKNLV